MQLVRLPLALIAFSSLACTMNAEQPPEDPAVTIVGNDESQLPVGTGDTTKPACGPQRFDFALSANDTRKCASFESSSARGKWTAFSTAPTFPANVSDKRCAAIWTPSSGSCQRAVLDDLKLNCDESVSLSERSGACAKLGPAGGKACSSAARVMDMPFGGMPPTSIELACPAAPTHTFPADRLATPPADFTRMYSGGCTSCGTISNGILLLTAPRNTGFVTFYDNSTTTPTPITLGFSGSEAIGTLSYRVSQYNPSGPVIVSF